MSGFIPIALSVAVANLTAWKKTGNPPPRLASSLVSGLLLGAVFAGLSDSRVGRVTDGVAWLMFLAVCLRAAQS